MKTETNTVESCLLATRQYNHLVIRVTLFWSEQNLSQLFSCLKKTPSTDWLDVCGARYHLWQVLAFVPLLTSSPLTKIGITYAQVFVGEKDLSNDIQIKEIGSMESEICTKMLRNLSEQLRAKFPLTMYTWLLHGKNCFPWCCFLRNYQTGSKHSRKSITAAKRYFRSWLCCYC